MISSIVEWGWLCTGIWNDLFLLLFLAQFDHIFICTWLNSYQYIQQKPPNETIWQYQRRIYAYMFYVDTHTKYKNTLTTTEKQCIIRLLKWLYFDFNVSLCIASPYLHVVSLYVSVYSKYNHGFWWFSSYNAYSDL